jgi:hypothetical protein
MELVLLKPESREWEYAWHWLEQHPINLELSEPTLALNEGEGWKYMGSLKQGNRILHQFKHLKHPKTGGIKELSLVGSPEFTEADIERIIPLK